MKTRARLGPRLNIRSGLLSPNVDGGEQEQPDHIHKVPIPSRGFKADMLFGSEMALVDTDQAHAQKDRSDQYVKAVEPRRHEEGRTIDVACKPKGSVAVFIGLEDRKDSPEHDRDRQTRLNIFAIVILMDQRMVRPCRGTTRQKKDQRIDQGQMPRVKGGDAFWWPDTIL